MDDLPVLVLWEIFDFLSIQEKLKFKLTCKKWRFVVENFCSQQNVCIYSLEYPYNESWCFSSQKVAEEDMIYLKFDRRCSRRFDFRMQFFLNVQKVYLFQLMEKVHCFLEEISYLPNLQMLMIDEDQIMKPIKLSSSSLQMFSFKGDFDRIELDTPNLSALILWPDIESEYDDPINFRFPLKVKHLECTIFTIFNSRLNGLKNLETFVCKEITSDFKLKHFPSLTRLELFPSTQAQLQVAKRIQERNFLRRDRLKIFVSGFEEEPIIFKEPIALDHRLGSQYLEYVLGKYPKLTGHLPWEFDLDFGTLVQCGHLLPRDFFDKFTRISRISMRAFDLNHGVCIENEQRNLIELIKRSKTRRLSLADLDVSLKREFYEQISLVRSIKLLEIGPHLEGVEFRHFLKLSHLLRLYIRVDKIPMLCEFASKAFEQLKLLSHFDFYSTTGKFKLRIRFDVYVPDESLEEWERTWEDPNAFYRRYVFRYYYSEKDLSLIDPPIVSRDCDEVHEIVRELKLMKEDKRIDPFFIN